MASYKRWKKSIFSAKLLNLNTEFTDSILEQGRFINPNIVQKFPYFNEPTHGFNITDHYVSSIFFPAYILKLEK